MRKGVSRAHYFECNDGKEYIVKFVNQIHGKTAINELVAGVLALEMNLPCPETVLVNVMQEIIDTSEDLTKREIHAGLHVGIQKLDNVWDFEYLDQAILDNSQLVNESDLYGTVSFDNWIINNDRDNVGNNMIQKLSNSSIKYIMIDFGHCFVDYNWNANTLQTNLTSENLVRIFAFIRSKITNRVQFDEWVNKIERFVDADISSIVDAVPDTWGLNAQEKTLLIQFIKDRRFLVRRLVNRL